MSQTNIEQQIRKRLSIYGKPEELTQLSLDSLQIRTITKNIKKILEEYQRISYLSMNDCELVSLQNFPYFPQLTVLQLSNNKIQDDDLPFLLRNSSITHLALDQNQLKSGQKVSILRQLPNLQQLQLEGNRLGQSSFYRDQIFQKIPQIKIIDCFDRKGEIAIESDSESEEQLLKGSNEKTQEKYLQQESQQQNIKEAQYDSDDN